MPSRIPLAFILIAGSILYGATAHAIVERAPQAAEGTVELRNASRVRLDGASPLARSAAWRSFENRYGRWSALWNESTGSPHRAFGEGIRLVGVADDAASVDRAVRVFIASHPELFGVSPTLEVAGIQRVRSTWYVRYKQMVNGVALLFTDWEFRVGANGKLFAFGADAHDGAAALGTSAALPEAVARAAARSGLAFDPATDRIEGGDELFMVPIAAENGTDYRLAYKSEVHIQNPPGVWTTLVDATTGVVLYRNNRVRHTISGNVSGTVHPVLPTDPSTNVPFPGVNVSVGGSTVTSDAIGDYSSPAAGTVVVSAGLSGPFSNVFRQDGGANGAFSTTVMDPTTVDIVWDSSNSHDAERDAFYHVNVAHDYIKTIDPTFTGLDYNMPTAVNILATCNAFWNGSGVNFFVAGGGCVNTATLPDVVYHEYGHAVNDKVYESLAFPPVGMNNGAIHEGLADVLAAFMLDDPVVGRGFFGPGTSIRDVSIPLRWPEDASGDGHITGLIVAGAFWDLRQSVGLSVAADLSHFSKYGRPDDVNDGVAMSEFFIETLVADDDDANLGNGTPHAAEIIAAFNAHGIGTGFFLDVAHAPLADQAAGGVYQVTADIVYSGPIGQLDNGSPTLHYATNTGAYQTKPMLPTGVANQFGANLPVPVAAITRYYISAADNLGGTAANPVGAPDPLVHTVIGGFQLTSFLHDMESDHGWTVGDAGDSATTGVWERVDPHGTFVGSVPVQPEFAHSFPTCYVTANGPAGEGAGVADIDGGKTTLFSNVFDATNPSTLVPMIEYYRWYSNNAGSNPSTDSWKVDLSNDGGATWTPVENTMQTFNDWFRVVFRIEDVVAATTQMQMRFVAADEGGGSLVEGAVDDFRLFGFPATVDVPSPVVTRLELAPATPNPFRDATALSFALPASGPVSLAVYDLGGRRVRTLASGHLASGPHRIQWNGRDDAGAGLASGVYFVRLRHAGAETMRRVLLVR